MSAAKPAGAPQRARKRGCGKAEILQAALREFAAKGYSGATTAGIARRAGVTQPLVHHHFSSKRRLWEAVLEGVYAEYRRMLDAAAASTRSAPLLDRMKARLTAFVHFSAARPESARLVMTESALGDETFDYVYAKYLKPEMKALQTLLREGEREGLLRTIDADLMPFLIIGAGIQPFLAPKTLKRLTGLDPADENTARRYAALIADTLLEGVLRKRS